MTESKAREASPIGLAINRSGRAITALLWDKAQLDEPIAGAYTQRPDTGEWERTNINHAARVRVEPHAWEPQDVWPEGWPETPYP
jgi:hypothetical protein